MTRCDAVVIGGGLVGSTIAYVSPREGLRAALINEGDVAHRASRAKATLPASRVIDLSLPAANTKTVGGLAVRDTIS
jgi:flavin-dependent dehydrogenase